MKLNQMLRKSWASTLFAATVYWHEIFVGAPAFKLFDGSALTSAVVVFFAVWLTLGYLRPDSE